MHNIWLTVFFGFVNRFTIGLLNLRTTKKFSNVVWRLSAPYNVLNSLGGLKNLLSTNFHFFPKKNYKLFNLIFTVTHMSLQISISFVRKIINFSILSTQLPIYHFRNSNSTKAFKIPPLFCLSPTHFPPFNSNMTIYTILSKSSHSNYSILSPIYKFTA